MAACEWSNILNCRVVAVREQAQNLQKHPAASFFKLAKYYVTRHAMLQDMPVNERRGRILLELRTILDAIQENSGV